MCIFIFIKEKKFQSTPPRFFIFFTLATYLKKCQKPCIRPWLKPFLDEINLIRIGGRLRNAEIPFEAKHQILIPKGYVAELIATMYHTSSAHTGVNQTLSEVRQKYWLLNGRVTTKKIIRSCVVCQRYNAKPEIPNMADLPKNRMDLNQPPFTNTGVDFFGPLLIKQGRKRIKKS